MRLLFPTQPLPIPATDAAAHATSTPWPVWAGSVASPVRFAPLAKKAAVRLWHRARTSTAAPTSPATTAAPSAPPRSRCCMP